MITLADIRAAAQRMRPHLRRTPVLEVSSGLDALTPARFALKLESLQLAGSFKARGALNRLMQLDPAHVEAGVVGSSASNMGLAMARAARLLGTRAQIHVTSTLSVAERASLMRAGAELLVSADGSSDLAALAARGAHERGAVYVPNHGDPMVMAGYGTLALELLEQMPDLEVALIAVGGGGLISAMAVALKALKPGIRIIGIEAVGAPTLHASLEAGRVIRLERLESRVASMACTETLPELLDLAGPLIDEIVLVSDDELAEATDWLWHELGVWADPSGAAAVAALRSGAVTLGPEMVAAGVVCGAARG